MAGPSEGSALVEVAVEVALVEVDVAHDHHVGGVAEDSTQPLDLATPAQLFGGEGVPELVSVDPEADPPMQALEEP